MPPRGPKREGLGLRHNKLRRASHELVPLPPAHDSARQQRVARPQRPMGEEMHYDDGWAHNKYGESAEEEAQSREQPRGTTPAPTRSRSVPFPSSRFLQEPESASQRSTQYQEMERKRAEDAVRERLEKQAKLMKARDDKIEAEVKEKKRRKRRGVAGIRSG